MQAISNWASQWKMRFNPDPKKQAQEAYFSKKAFNNKNVVPCFSQKHLRLLFDEKLNDHIQYKMTKCYKMIRIIKRLSVNIPRDVLLRIGKLFIRSHFLYGDIIYDKPNNESFKNKIKNIQYKACIAITDIKEHPVNDFINNQA